MPGGLAHTLHTVNLGPVPYVPSRSLGLSGDVPGFDTPALGSLGRNHMRGIGEYHRLRESPRHGRTRELLPLSQSHVVRKGRAGV